MTNTDGVFLSRCLRTELASKAASHEDTARWGLRKDATGLLFSSAGR